MDGGDAEIRRTPSTFLGKPLNKYDIDELEIDPQLQKAAYFKELSGAHALGKRTALNLSIPTAQKSLSSHDQVARDAQGRRRFHGAFTGGFSAGYFNTTGSAEGWMPSTFQGSRSAQTTTKPTYRNRIEDFMDEEDLENVTSQYHSLKVKQPRLVAPPVHTDELDAVIDRSYTVHELNLSALPSKVGSSVAYDILKAMGWKETPILFRRKLPLIKPDLTSKRSIGPQAYPEEVLRARSTTPSGLKKDPQPADLTVYALREEQATTVSDLLRLCDQYMRQATKAVYGLGYTATSLAEMASGHRANARTDTARRKAFRGEAFGVGVLEEENNEWDQIYDEEVQSVPEKALALLDAQQSVPESAIPLADDDRLAFVRSDNVKLFHDIAAEFKSDLLDHNTADECSLCRDFECPSPRESWKPFHVASSKETLSEQRLRSFEGAGTIVKKLLGHLERNNLLAKRPPASTEDVVEPEPRDLKAPPQSLPVANPNEPLWSRMTPDKKEALLGELREVSFRDCVACLKSTTKFTTRTGEADDSERQLAAHQLYLKDPQKQNRFEVFCLVLEEKLPVDALLKWNVTLDEKKEFAKQYTLLRQTSPAVKIEDVCGDVVKQQLRSKHHTSQATWSRISYNFQPHVHVCRLLQIPNPWAKKEFIDDRPKSAQGITTSELNAQHRSKSFISDVIDIFSEGSDRVASTLESSVPKTSEESVPAPSETQPVTQRPPTDVFDAVFGDLDLDDF